MSDMISEPRTRERELEAYIAELHARVCSLESMLRTLDQGVPAMMTAALEVADEDDPEHAGRSTPPRPAHPPTWATASSFASCSCGWHTDATRTLIGYENAEVAEVAHVAEALAR